MAGLNLIVAFFVVAGGIFGLIGSIGLVRLSTPMMRLHGPTKATTLGVGGILIAAILRGHELGTFPLSGVLIAAFLLATAPIVAMMLARLCIQETDERDLPEARDGAEWSVRTLEAPPPDS